MATWEVVKFYWQTMLGSTGSTLTATSTLSGTAVNNIFNMLEGDRWEATDTTSPQYLTYDAGAGNSFDADYLAILGHNLNTIGATVALQYSATGAWAGEEVTVFLVAPTADTVFLQEFTAPGVQRYWRLKISGTLTAAPKMAICIWGLKTSLDYARASYDPNAEDVKANVNLSDTGYLLGIHRRWSERSMSLSFTDADSALYSTVKAWWEGNGLNNFFVAWEHANNPGDVFLMHPDPKFNNPLTNGGAFRDITIKLKGRKE